MNKTSLITFMKIVALTGLLCGFICGTALGINHASFKGSALTRDGQTVEDVTITLKDEKGTEKVIEVDDDGTFTSRLFLMGQHTVTVDAPGYLVYAVKFQDAGPTGVPEEAQRSAVDVEQHLPELSVSPNHKYTYDLTFVPENFFNEKAQKEELGRVQNLILKAEEKINAGAAGDAIPILEKAIEKKADLGYPHYLMGVALFEIGNRERAISSFKKSIEIKSDLIGANYYLGKMAHEADRTSDAQKYYEAELKVSPNQAATLQILGMMYSEQGDKKRAAEMFERYRVVKPDDEKVLDDLVVLYTDLGDQKKVKAIVEAQEQLGKQDGASYYNLGTSYWKEKDFVSAESAFRKAVIKEPGLAAAHKGLAYCLIQLKKNTDALENLKKYLELKPDAKDRDKIQGIIKEIENIGK